MFFSNASENIVRLSFWINKMPGLAQCEDLEVQPNQTVPVPETPLKSWDITGEDYLEVGMFTNRPVWNCRQGYCTPRVTRTTENNVTTWTFK